MIRIKVQSTFCLLLSPLLVAQQVAAIGMRQTDSTVMVTLPPKTVISLELLEPVSSETARQGDKVRLAVAEDVVVKGAVLVRKGSPGIGLITKVRKAIPKKRDGEVKIEPASLTLADGRQVSLQQIIPSGGDEVCEGFASCAALTAIVVVLSPIALAGSIVTWIPHHERSEGNDLMLERCTRLWAHPAAKIRVVPSDPDLPRTSIDFFCPRP